MCGDDRATVGGVGWGGAAPAPPERDVGMASRQVHIWQVDVTKFKKTPLSMLRTRTTNL